jgi:hypothetical protein
MLSLLAVVPAFGPSPTCAGANFTTLGKLDLTEFTRKTWYIQEQQIVGYQPLESLYCVAATYDLAGASVPFFSGTVASVCASPAVHQPSMLALSDARERASSLVQTTTPTKVR